jgi:hypothetical protein
MLASLFSLTLFLREIYFAIGTFEIALPAGTKQESSDRRMHAVQGRTKPFQAAAVSYSLFLSPIDYDAEG